MPELNCGVYVFTQSEKETNYLIYSPITINPSSTFIKTLQVPNGKTGAIITVRATYNSSATNGAELNIYYSQDNSTYDTDTDQSFLIPFQAGATKQKSFIFPAMTKYIQVEIKNNDPNYSITIDHLAITFV